MAHKKPPFRREPTLRSARIIYLLTQGAMLTTAEIARLAGMSRWGARNMMEVISSSHDVPLAHIDGCWQIPHVWDLARRVPLDPSRLTAEELQLLGALTAKMVNSHE